MFYNPFVNDYRKVTSMPTIKEVAQAANVSVATVSRVLNHDKRVSLKTRERVLKVVKALDYTPNTLGRNLRVSATEKILVLLPSVLNQFFSSVMQGIEESVQTRGYQVMMSTTRSDPLIEQSYIEFLYNKSVDGIIFFNSEQTPEAINNLSKKYPITFCISSLEGAKASAVTIDNVRAAYDAVTSLIQAGHRKVALVYEPDASYGKLRGQGYEKALTQFGLPIRPEYLQPCDSSFDSGAAACKRLMALPDPPTAVFAVSDVIAAGVVQQLLRLQKIPGKDVDVFGFDNTDISRMITPTLSTIQQPGYLMGKLATELLFEKMENLAAPSKTIFVPHELIFRETTRTAVKPEEESK